MIAVYIMTFIFGTALYVDIGKDDRCKGDIIDIYYSQDQEATAYDKDCPYTKTLIDCKIIFNEDQCNVYYISRKHYDKFKKGYNELGMPSPFPKRDDVDRLYDPVNKGYNG